MVAVLVLMVLLAVFVIPGGWGYPLVALAALLTVVQAVMARRTRKLPPLVGAEALIGQSAVVVANCQPIGRVRHGGESWQARCAAGTEAEVGDPVNIVDVDRMTLVVRRAPTSRGN